MTPIEDLLGTLLRLVAVLVRNDSGWAESVGDLGASVAEASTTPQLNDALRQILAIYGGMGSFSDLVLQTSHGVSADNDELDALRSRLHVLAAAMVR